MRYLCRMEQSLLQRAILEESHIKKYYANSGEEDVITFLAEIDEVSLSVDRANPTMIKGL